MTERVSVRLSADVMDALQSLVDRGDFQSISDAVSLAIDSFVRARLTPDEIDDAHGCREVSVLDIHDSVLEDSIRLAVRNRLGAEDE